MRYLRWILRAVLHEPLVIIAWCLSAVMLFVPAIVPFSVFGGEVLHEEARVNYELKQQQLALSRQDMPPDIYRYMEDSSCLLELALGESNEKGFYSRIAQYDQLNSDLASTGTLETDLGSAAHQEYARQMSLLENPQAYATSVDLPAICIISTSVGLVPNVVLVSPALISIFIVCRATERQRLLGRPAVGPMLKRLAQFASSVVVSLFGIAAFIIPVFLYVLAVRGWGDPQYPVVAIRGGEMITETAGSCASQTMLLIVLSNLLLVGIGLLVDALFDRTSASVITVAVLACFPLSSSFFATSSPISACIRLIPIAYIVPSAVAGYVGEFPYADMTPVARLNCLDGHSLLTIATMICLGFILVAGLVRSDGISKKCR